MLATANVPSALLLDEELEDDLGVKALATARVVIALPLPKILPDPPLDLSAALTAKSVLVGLLPKELRRSALCVDTWLSDNASAARGFTLPLATPESNTAFLRLLFWFES